MLLFDGLGRVAAFKDMRLLHGHSQLMFVLAATGGLYLGCTERNNVANEGDEGGSAGSSSGAPGSGAAGSSSSAGSDATEGGSDGTGGSMGMSGAGLSDAGEPGQGMAGAGGDGSVPERPPAILVVGTDFGGVQATSYVNGAWDSVQVLAAPPLGGAMAAVLADGTGLAAMAGPYKGDEMGFYGASWDAPWATPRLVPGLIAADGVPILSRMSTFPGGALVAHTRNQNLGLTTYNATSESWTLDEDLGIAAAFHPAVSYVGTGDPLVVYFANGKYSSLRKVGSVWMGPTEVPITGEVIIEAPTNWEGYDGVHAEVDLVRRVGVDEVVGVFQYWPVLAAIRTAHGHGSATRRSRGPGLLDGL